jgi:hypothetical protein
MKRRSFFTILSTAPLGLGSVATAHEIEESGIKRDKARAQWQEQEEEVYSGTFKSGDGRLRLEVALIEQDPKTRPAVG